MRAWLWGGMGLLVEVGGGVEKGMKGLGWGRG